MADKSGGSGLRGLLVRLRGGGNEAGRPADDETLDSAPDHMGPYRVLEKLGQGGMRIVFAALDERLDRSLALKVLGAGATGDSAVKRFLREARAAALADESSYDPVRGQPRFEALRELADGRRAEALAAYRGAGGERLLGI